MLVGVYGKPTQAEPAAVARGFEALGHRICWRVPLGFVQPDDVFQDADIIVTFGQRLWSGRIAAYYREHGVPVLTVDLPPLRVGEIAETHRALWLNHVNWIPAEPQPCDRLERLHLRFEPHRDDGDAVLLCGQVADDAAHGMSTTELREWTQGMAESLAEFYPVTFRPHPRNRMKLDGFVSSDPDIPIETEFGMRYRAVATYNSTCGLTALLHGLPVLCDACASYAELAMTSLAGLANLFWPGLGKRIEFFCRLAYSQWTFDELASGEAVTFMLRQMEAA